MPLKKLCLLLWLPLLSACAHTRTFTPMTVSCRYEHGLTVHCIDGNGDPKDPPAAGLIFDAVEFERFNQECHE